MNDPPRRALPAHLRSQVRGNVTDSATWIPAGMFRRSVSTRTLAEATRGLAVLIDARIPLIQALEMISIQCEDKRLSSVLAGVRNRVRRGQSLGEALKEYPFVFSSLYVQLVSIGEKTSLLAHVLDRLASHLETSSTVKRKIKSALSYPLLILTVATSATVFLLVVVVPTFADMYKDYNAELPRPTQFLVYFSSFLLNHAVLLIAIFAALMVLGSRLLRNQRIRTPVEYFLLRIPFLAGFIRFGQGSMLARNLGTLVSNHVPLAEAIALLETSIDFSPVRDLLLRIKKVIVNGMPMSIALADNRILSPAVAQMIAVGEESGRLGDMLLHVAQHLEEELERRTDSMLGMMEPVIILIVGIVLGGILVALYLPLFELSQVVG